MAVPSAQVRPAQSAQAFYHWIHNGARVGGVEQNVQIFGADAMVTRDFEIGVTRFQNLPENKTIFNGRYRLDFGGWTSNPQAPEVAVGVRDVSNELNRTYYVVLSKSLHIREMEGPADLAVTLGFGHSHDDNGLLDGVFGGVDFSPGSGFRIQAEYDAQEWNACLRFYPTRTLSIDLGTFDSNLAAGLTYESSW